MNAGGTNEPGGVLCRVAGVGEVTVSLFVPPPKSYKLNEPGCSKDSIS